MTDPEEDIVTQNIRALIRTHLAHEPMDFDRLRQATQIGDSKQLSNALYQLKTAGEIKKGADGQYRLLAAGQAAAAAAPPAEKPNGGRAGRISRIAATLSKPRAADGANGARAILEKGLTDAQAALDDYLAAVANPRILGPLKAARDQARAALAAYDTTEAST